MQIIYNHFHISCYTYHVFDDIPNSNVNKNYDFAYLKLTKVACIVLETPQFNSKSQSMY